MANNMDAIVGSVVLGAVIIIIGFLVMTNVELSSAPTMEESVLSGANNNMILGIGNGINMAAAGLGVLAITTIAVIMGGIAGRGED